MFNGDLRRAVLEALAYSDIFEFPLRLEEIHRFLPLRASVEEVADTVSELGVDIETQGGYYFLARRGQIVDLRRERELRSRSLFSLAFKCGRILGSLPFIRMVALTGSLAVMNVSKDVDFDYMLVTQPGRLWTARAFALLLNRMTKKRGHTLCPNLIVSEAALEWPLHDLYSARELYQMIPIGGMDVYQRLIHANAWAKEFLPNCSSEEKAATPVLTEGVRKVATTFQSLLEFPLRGKFGDRFERWEMTRKIARFSKQEGFGEETTFNAEICQGNFHHHRRWTWEMFEGKLANLSALAAVAGGEALVNPSPRTATGAYKS
jgi:hypothetical protein